MNYNARRGGNAVINAVLILTVLAVTAAVIFPIFARTHDNPRKPTCQSNMKELGTAIGLYYYDYDAMLPSSVLVSKSKTWNEGDYKHFSTQMGNRGSTTGKADTAAALFLSYMKNKDILWCPSDPDKGRGRSVSYWYKAAIDRAWYGGKDSNGSWSCKYEGDFEFPADQIIFYERDGWHWGGQGKGFINGVTLNATFMDGHVKNIRLESAAGVRGRYDPVAEGEPGWFNQKVVDAKGNAVNPSVTKKAKWFDPRYYVDYCP